MEFLIYFILQLSGIVVIPPCAQRSQVSQASYLEIKSNMLLATSSVKVLLCSQGILAASSGGSMLNLPLCSQSAWVCV